MKTSFVGFLAVLLLSAATFAQTPELDAFNAACAGKIAGIQAAMKKGAPVDSRDKDGYTALSCAAKYGRVVTSGWLLDHGAQINDSKNDRNKTPLMQGAFQGQWNVEVLLIARHADLDHQAVNKWTALHDAAYIGNLAIVRSLVNAGASRFLINERGEIPLGTAVRALADCQAKRSACPITRGDTKASITDFQNVVAYLKGLSQ